MLFSFFCHVRKSKSLRNLRPARITIDVALDGQEPLHLEQSVSPTINWVAGSTPEDSVPVTFDIPAAFRNHVCQFKIMVDDNDVLICGYQDVNFEIVSNPLWNGQRGTYDISGHVTGGGTMGTGSLAIDPGQTVTFDGIWHTPHNQKGYPL